MPKSIPHRIQSLDLQHKLIVWSQHKKNIDMKKTNNDGISKPTCLNLYKLAQQIHCKAQWSVVLKLLWWVLTNN